MSEYKILAGICTLATMVFLLWIGHVESSLADGKDDHSSHTQRLTTIETNYTHILSGIARIEGRQVAIGEKVDKMQNIQAELREKTKALPPGGTR